MNMEYKDFVKTVKDIYYEKQQMFDDHLIEDWEQEFFNALDDKLDNDKEEVFAHIYYGDDDSLSDVADGILNSLQDRRLLRAYVWEEYDTCVIVVGIASKKGA